VKKKFMPVIAFTAAALVGCSSVGAGQQAVEVDSWGDPTVSGCAVEESQVGTWTVLPPMTSITVASDIGRLRKEWR
jgi:hypothetical protein